MYAISATQPQSLFKTLCKMLPATVSCDLDTGQAARMSSCAPNLMTPASVVFVSKDRQIGPPSTRWARVMGSDDVSFSLAVFRKHRWIGHNGL